MNCKLMPNHRWFGTRKGDKYHWLTMKQVGDISEHLSYGIVELGLAPEVFGDG